jgi:L-alanine-DL-glutamate epimerase-like enolase superfamily enzyme
MNCTILPLNVKLKRKFVVTGGCESAKRNFLVVLDDIGLGEAAGSVHYGVSSEEIGRDLLRFTAEAKAQADASFFELLARYENDLCAPAVCALSTAWHDLKSKQKKMSLHERLGIPRPEATVTSVTISAGDMEAWEIFLRDGMDCLKIKTSDDKSWNDAVIEKICGDDPVRYRIDANAGWDIDTAMRFVHTIPAGRVELIEQPFHVDDAACWTRLRSQTSIPLFMDESILNETDVKRVAGYVDGINIKIQKSGRLETAIAAIHAAKRAELQVMIGCMIESSVGIAAAYQLAGLADFIDLDGRLLIECDPFRGLRYEKNILQVRRGYGHGVALA